jgi:hypothetical protein
VKIHPPDISKANAKHFDKICTTQSQNIPQVLFDRLQESGIAENKEVRTIPNRQAI